MTVSVARVGRAHMLFLPSDLHAALMIQLGITDLHDCEANTFRPFALAASAFKNKSRNRVAQRLCLPDVVLGEELVIVVLFF